jgi:hypothetical protein
VVVRKVQDVCPLPATYLYLGTGWEDTPRCPASPKPKLSLTWSNQPVCPLSGLGPTQPTCVRRLFHLPCSFPLSVWPHMIIVRPNPFKSLCAQVALKAESHFRSLVSIGFYHSMSAPNYLWVDYQCDDLSESLFLMILVVSCRRFDSSCKCQLNSLFLSYIQFLSTNSLVIQPRSLIKLGMVMIWIISHERT